MSGQTDSTQPPLPSTEGLITAGGFAVLLNVSKRTVFRLRARGVLPPALEISSNIVRWRLSDVRTYLDALATRKPRRRRGGGPMA